LANWVDGSQILLKRFENYWGEMAKVSIAVIRFQPESTGRALYLQAGVADGAAVVSVEDFPTILADSDLVLINRAPLVMAYIAMNNRSKPFNDVRVREAIALTIDQQRLADNFYPTGTVAAHSFTPCAIPFGCAGDPWYTQDLVKAKQLLAEAGFPDGFNTTISVRDKVSSHTPYPLEIATDIQDQLKQVGINADIQVLESTAWVSNLVDGTNVGLAIGGGWTPDYIDPTNYLNRFFTDGGSSQQRLGDPFADLSSALLAAGATSDATERESLYAEANNLIKKYVPLIPTVHTGSAVAYLADVAGAHASSFELESLSVLTPGNRDKLVWVIPNEPGTLYCPVAFGGQDPLRVCVQISEGLYGFEPGSGP